MKHSLQLEIQSQPSDTSCGPTCLAAVYDFWEIPIPLSLLIEDVGQLGGGGTLAVVLGTDALRRGFSAEIITYNLQVFDPTWFNTEGEMVSAEFLSQKLKSHRQAKKSRKDLDQHRLEVATNAYCEFLELGGKVCMQQLDEDLLVKTLSSGAPILCGLSATYLYHESRERSDVNAAGLHVGIADDLAGDPQGHFVVLHGYDSGNRTVLIADPLHPNPFTPTNKYVAPLSRVTAAIMLGIVTFDANLLTIVPRVDSSFAKSEKVSS